MKFNIDIKLQKNMHTYDFIYFYEINIIFKCMLLKMQGWQNIE